MRIKATEGSFQGRLIDWGNQIIREESLPFDKLEQLESVRTGRQRREPDVVLWVDRVAEDAFCEFELKQPSYSPVDDELVSAANAKADRIGAPYFVTWNVNDLILWDRKEVDRPLMDRRNFTMHVSNIREMDEIHNPATQDQVHASLRRLLRTLADLRSGKSSPEVVFRAMSPDERFIQIVHLYVRALSVHFHDAIRTRAAEDRQFRRDLARWFKAQGWNPDLTEEGYAKAARQSAHILLNRIIFYDALQTGYTEQLPELSLGRTLKGDQVRCALNGYFQKALRIDYQPVFESHLIDDLEFPEDVASQLRGFAVNIMRWELRDLRYDIIGRVFERLVPPEERKWLGQFFTRSDLVDLIVAFCVSAPDGPFLDPACGAGTFPVRLYSRLRYLDPSLGHRDILERLWGFDIAGFPAHLATINLYLREPRLTAFPRIVRQDFFGVFPDETEFRFPFDPKGGGMLLPCPMPKCRAVVGNPPYTRQEELEEVSSDVGSSGSYKEHMLDTLDRDFGRGQVHLSKRAGIYAHFFMHGTAFLRPGGRLGFVTSNSWLDVDYGADIQRFFLERFKIVAIIGSRCERWFEDAAVNTAITVLEECADSQARERNPVRFVSLKRPLAEIVPPAGDVSADRARWATLDKLVAHIESAPSDLEDGSLKLRVVTQGDLQTEGWDPEDGKYVGAKWGKYLRAPAVYFDVVRRSGTKMIPLKSVAQVRFGIKTGANGFFYAKDLTDSLSTADLRNHGVSPAITDRIRVIEAGDGSRHPIEAEFLVPAILRVGHIDKPLFSIDRLDKKLVMINRAREDLKRTRVLKYIRWGEEPHPHRDRREGRGGYHERESCASRDPWYALGQRTAAPILYPIAHKRRPVIGLNHARVQAADNFLEVVPSAGVDDMILAASLFSTFSQLQAEIEGRVNFGEGVLKTQAVDVRKFYVLDARAVDPTVLARLREAFLALADRPIELIWSEVHRADRQRLDDVMLEALGFDDAEERLRVRQAIYDALCALVSERMDKPKTVKPTRSSDARLDIPAMAESLVHDETAPAERRSFPSDFLPFGVPGDTNEYPEGPVSMPDESLLQFQAPILRVGDVEFRCHSLVHARYTAYALRCGHTQVFAPHSDELMQAAIRAYEAYCSEMTERVDALIAERTTTKSVAKAVRKEALRLLGVAVPATRPRTRRR